MLANGRIRQSLTALVEYETCYETNAIYISASEYQTIIMIDEDK